MGLGEAEDEVIGGTLRDWKWFIAIPNINTESDALNIAHLYNRNHSFYKSNVLWGGAGIFLCHSQLVTPHIANISCDCIIIFAIL